MTTTKESDPTYKLAIEGIGHVRRNPDIGKFKLSESLDLTEYSYEAITNYLEQEPDNFKGLLSAEALKHYVAALASKYGQNNKDSKLEESFTLTYPFEDLMLPEVLWKIHKEHGIYPLDVIEGKGDLDSVKENNTSIQNVLVESLINKDSILGFWTGLLTLPLRDPKTGMMASAIYYPEEIPQLQHEYEKKHSESVKVVTFEDPYLESLRKNVESMIEKNIVYPKMNRSTDCSVLALQFANMGILWDIVEATTNRPKDYHSDNLTKIVFSFCVPKWYNIGGTVEGFINKNFKEFSTQRRTYLKSENYVFGASSMMATFGMDHKEFSDDDLDRDPLLAFTNKYIQDVRETHQIAVQNNRNDILMFELKDSFAKKYVHFLNTIYNNFYRLYLSYRKVSGAGLSTKQIEKPLVDVRAKNARYYQGYKNTRYGNSIVAIYATRVAEPVRGDGFSRFMRKQPDAKALSFAESQKLKSEYQTDIECIYGNFDCEFGPNQHFGGPLPKFSFYADTETVKDLVDKNFELDCSRINDKINMNEIASHLGIRIDDTENIVDVCNVINKTVKEKRKAMRGFM